MPTPKGRDGIRNRAVQRADTDGSFLAPPGGFVAHVESTCLLDDDGNPQDFTYCISFNKDLLACWDPEEGKIAPCEFGMLYKLATSISDFLNNDEQLLQRLGKGLQNCAEHSKPFWNVLTHRTSEQRGC